MTYVYKRIISFAVAVIVLLTAVFGGFVSSLDVHAQGRAESVPGSSSPNNLSIAMTIGSSGISSGAELASGTKVNLSAITIGMSGDISVPTYKWSTTGGSKFQDDTAADTVFTLKNETDAVTTENITLNAYDDGFLFASASAVLKVRPPETVYASGAAISPNSLGLRPGDTQQVSVVLTPQNATVVGSWRVENTKVATVSDTGKVTAVSAGKTTLTYTVAKSKTENIVQSIPIEVSATMVRVVVTPGTQALSLGQTAQLTAAIEPASTADKTLVWTSSNTAIAQVSASGLVTATGAGSATITAALKSNPEMNGSATVTVSVPVNGTLSFSEGGSPALYKDIDVYQGSSRILSLNTGSSGTFTAVLAAGSYTLKSKPYETGYNPLAEPLVIPEGSKGVSLALKYPGQLPGKIDVTIKDTAGKPVVSSYVSIYTNDPYQSLWGYTNGNGQIEFSDLQYNSDFGSTFQIYYSTNEGAYGYEAAILTAESSQHSLSFTVPEVLSLSGKVTTPEGEPLYNLPIYIQKNGNSYATYAYTAADGSYSVRNIPEGTYSVSIASFSPYYAITPATVTLSGGNATVPTLIAHTGTTLTGKILVDGKENAVQQAYVVLRDADGNHVADMWTTGSSYKFDGLIRSEGGYQLDVQNIYDANWNYLYFENGKLSFKVTASDLAEGILVKDINVNEKLNQSEAFKGAGNSLTTNLTIAPNKARFNITGKYKNNSTQRVTATFNTTLTGADAVPGEFGSLTHTATLEPGQDGRFIIAAAVNVGKDEHSAAIETKVTVGGATYDFAKTSIEVVNISLNAPSIVKTAQPVKVFGEVNEGSTVTVLEAGSGKTLAQFETGNSRWYSKELPGFKTPGTYEIYAQTKTGEILAVSPTMKILVQDDPVTIKKVVVDEKGSVDLTINRLTGVRAFSHSVYPTLEGFPMNVRTQFDNDSRISSLTYQFAGRSFPASKDSSGSWHAYLSGWYGNGFKELTALVTTTDGKAISYTLAEVTLLVDPSGFITDADNGKPISGASVECLEKVPGTGSYAHWNNEIHRQPPNPQLTDNEGHYGWDVPDGTYKITVSKPGYESSTSDAIEKYKDGINILPPALDVNLALIPTAPMAITGAASSGGEIILSFSRYIKSGDITVTDEGAPVNITTSVSENTLRISSADFVDAKQYTVETKNVLPKSGDVSKNPQYALKSDVRKVVVNKASDNNNPSYGGGSSSGSSGSSSGGAYRAPNPSSSSISGLQPSAIKKAPRIGDSAVVSLNGSNSKTTKKQLTSALAALRPGEKLMLRQTQNKKVTYQFTIDPASVTAMADNLNFGVSVDAKATRAQFEKFFKNRFALVSLKQQGAFGFSTRLAVKVDLTGLDKDKLMAYRYDSKSNTYKLLNDTKVTVDSNGYVIMNVTEGGMFLISDQKLTKK